MEFKVVMYVLVGLGYLVYNLYRKLNLPPQEQQSDGQTENADRIGEVKAPKYRSVEELIQEIRNQESQQREDPTAVKESIPSKEDRPISEEQLGHKKEEPLVVASSYKKGVKTKLSEFGRPNHLDSIHLFDYDKKQSGKKKRRSINLRNAVVYDAILRRPH